MCISLNLPEYAIFSFVAAIFIDYFKYIDTKNEQLVIYTLMQYMLIEHLPCAREILETDDSRDFFSHGWELQIKCKDHVLFSFFYKTIEWYFNRVLHACMLSSFSRVWLIAALWTVTCQVPLSVGFSRQENWGGLPSPSPGDLPDTGIEPVTHVSHISRGVCYNSCHLGNTRKTASHWCLQSVESMNSRSAIIIFNKVVLHDYRFSIFNLIKAIFKLNILAI